MQKRTPSRFIFLLLAFCFVFSLGAQESSGTASAEESAAESSETQEGGETEESTGPSDDSKETQPSEVLSSKSLVYSDDYESKPEGRVLKPEDLASFVHSESGSFTYSYPIALPSGRAGVQPELAINYSSAGGNGILGMGFYLSGLPVIERDESYPVAFGPGDRYLYQGRQLVYRAVDGRFHTERESFERIQAFGAPGGAAVSDPNTASSYWVVTRKDGTKYYFGSTPDSRVDAVGKNGLPRLWALSRVEDTSGNYYEVEYEEDVEGGDYYPIRITYTKHDASPASAHH